MTEPTAACGLLSAPVCAVLLLATTLGTGCDTDEEDAMDLHAIVHIDVDAAKRAPWVAKELAGKDADIKKELGACADLYEDTDSITVGIDGNGDHRGEIYFEGNFDATGLDACSDFIADQIKTKARDPKKGDKVKTQRFGDDVFVITFGDVKPSKRRLDNLKAADPTPAGGQTMWVVARDKDGKGPIDLVEGWGRIDTGLDLHAEVKFDDAAQATKIYGEAMLGLTALRLSGDAGFIADAVSASADGDTVTVDFAATPGMIEKVKTMGRAKAAAHHGHGGSDHHDDGIQIQIGVGNDDQ